jgi:predicted DNA-binding transcriptional regulator YafY
MIRLGKLESAQQAADELGVSRRTIERDLDTLRYELNAELQFDRAQGRYRYEGDPVTVPAQWLNEREIALILIAERALRVFTNTSFGDKIHPAFNRLLAPIRHDKKMMRYILDLCNGVHFHQPFIPSRDVHTEFAVVLDAILQRKRLSMIYHTAGKKNEVRRQVEPYALINNGGEWYLIGRCLRSRSEKTFTVTEIYEPRMEDFFFDIPESFKAEDHIGDGFGLKHGQDPVEIELRITPPAVSWVRRHRWHPSQKIEAMADGIKLTLHCPVTEMLERWILQMGGSVEICAPQELRTRVRDMAQSLVVNNG